MAEGSSRPGEVIYLDSRVPAKKVQSWGEFILTKQVPGKGGKKTSLGIKKLINKFEHRLNIGEQVPGSILATPSAPQPEGDSDCESWGSDFDDDVNEKPSSLEAHEEFDNDINNMLEAAMQRSRNLESSTFATTSSAGNSPGTDVRDNSEATSPGAPPLPPRNPELPLWKYPGNSTRSIATSVPGLRAGNVASASQSPLPGHSAGVALPPRLQMQSAPKSITSPPTTPLVALNAASQATGGSKSIKPQHANRRFPPDVNASSFNNPSISNSSSETSVPGQSSAPPSFPMHYTNISAIKANSSIPKSGHTPQLLLSKHQVKSGLPSSQVTEPEDPIVKAVPPPLPTRPPPVTRYPVKHPVRKTPISSTTASRSVNNSPTTAAANESLATNFPSDATTEGKPVFVLPPTGLVNDSLQNSAVSGSVNTTSSLPVVSPACASSSGLQKNSAPLIKSKSPNVPKILRELDAAVLKQAMLKKSARSISTEEIDHSVVSRENCSPSENAEEASQSEDNFAEDYLDPKDTGMAGLTEFTPDRPTLPRRLKHARSLPIINNLVESFRRDPAKNKGTDEKELRKPQLQTPQVINENTEVDVPIPSINDEIFGYPWYHAVTWAQAQFKLTSMEQNGAFLVRPSSRGSQGMPYTISVFTGGRIINCHICCTRTPDRKYALGKPKPNQKMFDTIPELIRYYQSTPAELKFNENEPPEKVCFLITPSKDNDKIYADA